MPNVPGDPAPARELERLLQAECDAAQAYTLAIGHLSNEGLQLALVRYRGDHQRNLVELARMIRDQGVSPERPSAPGPSERAPLEATSGGGGEAILQVVQSAEARMRETYRNGAEAGICPDFCRHAARLVERHQAWAAERALAWPGRFRRLVVRYERHAHLSPGTAPGRL